MKTLYLDCFAGISGNMLLGAFIDAGLPEETLRQQLSKLSIHGYNLNITKVVKCGIHATYVDVQLTHGHDHHHRHLADIFDIIETSQLSSEVKENSKKIFLLLAEAEAKVHGTTIEEIHFHEVGAVDAIIDIIGSVFALHYLGIKALYVSKLQVGSGFVECCHGQMPIPAPATAELLTNIPYYNGNIMKELVTPTGAAIIAALGTNYGAMPENFISHTISYGAGTWNLDIPNVLRMHIGELATDTAANETIIIEANIDDLNPQIYPYVMDLLFEIGAYDVWLTPIIMKKNRSATQLSVLLSSHLLDHASTILFKETSTIGLRYFTVERKVAMREIRSVTVPWGQANVKISSYDGTICNISPEYEDCKKFAMKYNIPLKKVQQTVLEAITINKA